jgi:hypothetical protein
MPSFLDLTLPSADGMGAVVAVRSESGWCGRFEKIDDVSRMEMSESQVV